jgi:hypothetical protein
MIKTILGLAHWNGRGKAKEKKEREGRKEEKERGFNSEPHKVLICFIVKMGFYLFYEIISNLMPPVPP